MSCKCAKLDPDSGRWNCSVSGDGCMYLIPDSKRCAKKYGEGPDVQDIYKNEDKKCEKALNCNFKDKYQRLPRNSRGALGLCPKLK